MKVGIIGAGFVGATAGCALVLGEVPSELVFVDVRPEKAEGEAMDVSHATPFSHPVRVYAGDYAALAGSALVVSSAGVNQKPGEARMSLLDKNAAIFREIVPEVTACESGWPPTRVIGSSITFFS